MASRENTTKDFEKMKRIALVIMAAALLAPSCKKKDTLLADNIENAKTQIGALMQVAEQGDTIRIPSSIGKDGKLSFVPIDDWVSGFFAGELWYMYELTGDEMWADHARKHTEILDSVQHLKWHHDVGFMIYDSYGKGIEAKGIEEYKPVVVETAKSLSTRFRPGAGIIQSWDADKGWQALRGWKCPVIIDNMMNLELLFKATEFSGDSTFFKIAVSHADQTMKNHFRDDYSCYHVVDYDPETGEVRGRCTAQGYADESAWARGQAWALYGYATAYEYTGYDRYLQQAENVANFLFSNKNMPEDLIPYWDFDDPKIPDTYRDASAGAVIASAMYELYKITGKKDYKAKADKMMETLSSPAFRAEPGQNCNFILMHSVASLPHGNGIDVPLNYADYYFLEALLRRSKLK